MDAMEFWFSLVSPYAYLSAMRLDALVENQDVNVSFEPMAMPPIYKALGWAVNPFADFPYKLDYVWHDVARTAKSRGLAFRKPNSFPQDPFLATQTALIGFEEDWGWQFCKGFYVKNFQEGAPPGDAATVGGVLRNLKLDADSILERAQKEGVEKLRAQTEKALKRSVFGAPFMFVGDEPFWGDDRLEMAIARAHQTGSA